MKVNSLLILASMLILTTIGLAQAQNVEEICDPRDVRMATTPVQPQNIAGLKLFLEKEANLPDRTDVLLVGDSLLANWPSSKVNNVFRGMTVVNWAIPADRIQNTLWRLNNTNISKLKPKITIFMLGVNSISDGVEPCALLIGVQQIVSKFRKMWPNTYILNIQTFPFGKGYMAREQERRIYNASIQKIFERIGNADTINIDDTMSCGRQHQVSYLEESFSFIRSLYNCENYKEDGTHLSESGYEILGSLVLKKLADHKQDR